MKTRTLVAMAVVFGALVVAATAPSWRGSSDESSSASSARDVLGLAQIDVDDIERIVVKKSDDVNVVATREGSAWRVGAKPANSDRVDAFLTAVEEAADARATLVSRTDSRHEGLGLTSQAGSVVTLELDGGETRSFIVGSAGDLPRTVYVRQSDDSEAWQVESELLTTLPTDAAAWQATADASKGGEAAAAGEAAKPASN
jgi:hypothetical protein